MKKKNIFWGLLFIFAAIFIFVSKLGYLQEVSLIKIIFTVILAGIIITSIVHVNFWGILFPAAFICIFFDEQLGITALTPWSILAIALLGSVGLSLIFRRKHCFATYVNHNHEHIDEEIINDPDGNTVDCFVNFGASIKYVNSDNFERANIKCTFGSAKVYFDNAVIPSGNAIIHLNVSFGGVELFIPKTWTVIQDASAVFGGIEEKNRHMETNGPVVTLKGNISFAGVQIIYI
jgi:predicted membrane protein